VPTPKYKVGYCKPPKHTQFKKGVSVPARDGDVPKRKARRPGRLHVPGTRLVEELFVRTGNPRLLPQANTAELAQGLHKGEQLSPTIQKYILDHGIEGPRPGGQQGTG
jgi:hypothetical protein